MITLRIEHRVRDVDMWTAALNRDSKSREHGGVRRHRVYRPIDEPNSILLDRDVASVGEAEAFLTVLRRDVWSSATTAPALIGSQQARIIEEVAR